MRVSAMRFLVAKQNRTPFAVRLRELRIAANATQRDVAERVGVSVQTYKRWEWGDSEPLFSQLVVIAEMFGKTTNDFVTDEG